MSELFYNKKENQLQFINLTIGIHDLNCHCNNPGFHVLKILSTQIGKELNNTDKQTIQQCLGGSDPIPTAADDGLDIAEDLEKLFEEDVGEDDG